VSTSCVSLYSKLGNSENVSEFGIFLCVFVHFLVKNTQRKGVVIRKFRVGIMELVC